MRKSFDAYMLDIVDVVATRSTCPRRMVGCVITNNDKHIKATGYNGVPKGWDHCTDSPCGGQDATSGEGLDLCMATHAEQNALLQCADVMDIGTIYISTSPCMTCAKLIANTGCMKIVFRSIYDQKALDFLFDSHFECVCIPE